MLLDLRAEVDPPGNRVPTARMNPPRAGLRAGPAGDVHLAAGRAGGSTACHPSAFRRSPPPGAAPRGAPGGFRFRARWGTAWTTRLARSRRACLPKPRLERRARAPHHGGDPPGLPVHAPANPGHATHVAVRGRPLACRAAGQAGVPGRSPPSARAKGTAGAPCLATGTTRNHTQARRGPQQGRGAFGEPADGEKPAPHSHGAQPASLIRRARRPSTAARAGRLQPIRPAFTATDRAARPASEPASAAAPPLGPGSDRHPAAAARRTLTPPAKSAARRASASPTRRRRPSGGRTRREAPAADHAEETLLRDLTASHAPKEYVRRHGHLRR